MDKNELYRDIARRTNGEIYIGVVGPGTVPASRPSSSALWTLW